MKYRVHIVAAENGEVVELPYYGSPPKLYPYARLGGGEGVHIVWLEQLKD